MEKICQDCKQKPLRYNNRSGFCSDCYDRHRPRATKGTSAYLLQQQKNKEIYAANSDREKARARAWRFGLTADQYNSIRESQNYCCAICERSEQDIGVLHVDHDHSCCPTSRGERTCGKCVRKLLCRECNHGLGNFKDDPELLRKAINYVEEYKIL